MSTNVAEEPRTPFDGLPLALRPFHTYPLRVRVLISHMPLTLTVGVVVLLIAIASDTPFPNPVFRWGVTGIAILTVLAGLVPWERLPYPSYLVLPVLDFIPIGALIHGAMPSLSGISLLLVFPVLWMTWSWVRPKLMCAVVFVMSGLVVNAPLIVGSVEPTAEELVRYTIVPSVMLGLAVASAYVNRQLAVQQEEMEQQYEANRRQRRLLEAIVDTAPVGVLAIDENGEEILKNRRQRQIELDAEPEVVGEDKGEGRLQIFHGRDRRPIPVAERPVRRAVRGEQMTEERLWIGRPDRERALNVSAQPLLDDGEFVGSVLVFQDVTELVSALAAQDAFVSSVSHEFRTPLTSILGYTDLLVEEADDAEDADPMLRHGLVVVQRNAERLLGLVDDLLGSASGVMAVSRELVSLGDIATDCAETAAPQAAAAGLELVLDDGDRAQVLGDRVKLAQAIDNLVSNAVKYTESGRVVLRTGVRDGEGIIEVEDTGVGMTPEEQERMFDRFYRADSARSSTVPGTGLGMAVVRTIIDAHGGRLEVHSEPGRGTRVVVLVPLAEAAEDAPAR